MKTNTLLPALLSCLLFLLCKSASAATTGNGDGNDCHADWVKAILYFGATLETFSRGFCLGFGIRMMKFTWVDGKDISLRERVQLSAESGLAVAAVVHGSAIFLPHHFRQQWFDY